MRIKKLTSVALIATLAVSVAPATAWAADDTKAAASSPAVAPAVDLRGATARALDATNTIGQPQVVSPTKPQKSGRRNAAAGGSGGGGGSMGTVMTIVGVAASIGTTYWVIKEMHKVESPTTPTPTPQIVR